MSEKGLLPDGRGERLTSSSSQRSMYLLFSLIIYSLLMTVLLVIVLVYMRVQICSLQAQLNIIDQGWDNLHDIAQKTKDERDYQEPDDRFKFYDYPVSTAKMSIFNTIFD